MIGVKIAKIQIPAIIPEKGLSDMRLNIPPLFTSSMYDAE